MTDCHGSITPGDPHIVYLIPRSGVSTPTTATMTVTSNQRKPKPANMFLQNFKKHLKNEYWSYIALAGLTCLYTGVMVAVFGFSNILDSNSGQIAWFGILLILMGVALILASMIFYHRKVRRLRPCICCGMDDDESLEPPLRNKKRLRFAPNLISPYYEIAREKEKTMMVARSPVVVYERSEVVTTPVQVFGEESEMMETEERRAEATEGSDTALITTDKQGSKVTLC